MRSLSNHTQCGGAATKAAPTSCLAVALVAALSLSWGGSQPAAAQLLPAKPAAPDFAPTIPNQTPAPTPAPAGMVWIPGGEFSMGCLTPSEGHCTAATMNSVKDSQPIHRVYVDGFWMDKTDVTNDEFDKFVKATGLQDRRGDRADQGAVPHRAAGESGGRFHGLHSHAGTGAAE